jgi:hypothetical protein
MRSQFDQSTPLLLVLFVNHDMLCLHVFLGGGLLFRHGFGEIRNRLEVSGTPMAKASSTAIGLTELFGRGRGSHPTAAPITGNIAIWSYGAEFPRN